MLPRTRELLRTRTLRPAGETRSFSEIGSDAGRSMTLAMVGTVALIVTVVTMALVLMTAVI